MSQAPWSVSLLHPLALFSGITLGAHKEDGGQA